MGVLVSVETIHSISTFHNPPFKRCVPSPPCVDFSHCSSAAASASRGTAVRDPGNDRISCTWALDDRKPGRPWMDPMDPVETIKTISFSGWHLWHLWDFPKHIQPYPTHHFCKSWCPRSRSRSVGLYITPITHDGLWYA